jgi:hypothetical protein
VNDLHAIGNFRTVVEAEVAAGLLREAEIPYLMQSAEGIGLVLVPGGATILVRPDDFAQAAMVLGYPRLL